MANPSPDGDYLKRLPPEYYRGQACVHWTMTIEDRKTGWLVPIFYYKFRELLTHTMFRYGICSNTVAEIVRFRMGCCGRTKSEFSRIQLRWDSSLIAKRHARPMPRFVMAAKERNDSKGVCMARQPLQRQCC